MSSPVVMIESGRNGPYVIDEIRGADPGGRIPQDAHLKREQDERSRDPSEGREKRDQEHDKRRDQNAGLDAGYGKNDRSAIPSMEAPPLGFYILRSTNRLMIEDLFQRDAVQRIVDGFRQKEPDVSSPTFRRPFADGCVVQAFHRIDRLVQRPDDFSHSNFGRGAFQTISP